MKYILYFCMVIFTAFIACTDDADEPQVEELSGELQNVSFEAGEARFFEETDDKILIEIFPRDITFNNLCVESPETKQLTFFSEDNMNRQELFLDLENFEGFTVTLHNPAESKSYIATEGYFQIKERSDTGLLAEMRIFFDGQGSIEGIFEAVLCP